MGPGPPGLTDERLSAVLVALRTDGGRQFSKIRRLLIRKGVLIPYAALHRFAVAELDLGRTAATVPVADGEPGHEVQLDTGRMVLLRPDAQGRHRRIRAWIFTPGVSRLRFVYWSVTRGVAVGRPLLGVSFYGYEYPSACSLGHNDVSGMTSRPYRSVAGMIGQRWTRSFDGEAQVPYLLRDGGCGVVSCDDAVSLAQNATDCAPLLDSVFAAPQEIQGLRLARSESGTVLSWSTLAGSAGPGTAYDVITGSIVGLHEGATDATCLNDDLPDAQTIDARAVGEGGWFYLLREQNVCGMGVYGGSFADGLAFGTTHSRADCVVSGDRALLRSSGYEAVAVLTPRRFIERISSRGAECRLEPGPPALPTRRSIHRRALFDESEMLHISE